MKNFLLLLILAISSSLLAQNSNFDGTWVGYTYDENEEMVGYLLVEIEGNTLTQYDYNSETEEYHEMTFNQQEFRSERNNAVYFWINQGGAWSETQSYHISLLNDTKAEYIWTRQVNNVKEGEDNEVWDMRGTGSMEKVLSDSYASPAIDAQSSDLLSISSVTVTGQETSVIFTFTNNTDAAASCTFYGPDSNYAMYITNPSRSIKYKLLNINGASFEESFSLSIGETRDVMLSFEPIGDLKTFDLLEPGSDAGEAWNFYGVQLKN